MLRVVVTLLFTQCSPGRSSVAGSGLGQFNGETAKPHVIWSNDRNLIQAILDRGGSVARSKMAGFKKKLATTYTDKSGVRRHSGKKKELKESQKLGFITLALPRLAVTASWHDHSCCSSMRMCPGPTRQNLEISWLRSM